MAWRREVPPGSESRARSQGVPQEPGRPLRSPRQVPAGGPGDQLQARGRGRPRPWERNAGATGIPPSEGNEARRDGRRGVGAPHSTDEAGEPTRGTPWREGGCRVMEPLEGKMPGTPSPDPISTRRQRIAELARQVAQAAFTTLAHHIDIDWLREAYRRTRKDGAAGVDGQTAADYAANLEDNLQSLLDRAKSGRYQAPPVRRVHIPKGGPVEAAADRHPDVRGQGPPAGGRDGAGGRLRAGLPGLLVRLPAGRSAHQALGSSGKG